jgi:hypothetical protein
MAHEDLVVSLLEACQTLLRVVGCGLLLRRAAEQSRPLASASVSEYRGSILGIDTYEIHVHNPHPCAPRVRVQRRPKGSGGNRAVTTSNDGLVGCYAGLELHGRGPAGRCSSDTSNAPWRWPPYRGSACRSRERLVCG